ncbi:MAG: A24 family peptidase [Coriobacteriales bacterium]|jgi:prepilin signal peptidase PulO-like enzyme (type II secretory pathway)|nr:A24 family peptidase [Coriobacteriales bacterium]
MGVLLSILLLLLVFAVGAVVGRLLRLTVKVPAPVLIVEALTGALGLLSYLAFMPPAGFLLPVDSALVFSCTAYGVGLLAAWLPCDFAALAGAALSAALVFALLCSLLAITLRDSATREIPNALSLTVALLGLVSIFIGPTAAFPWTDHLIGAFAVSVPLLVLALVASGSFGLGDVKLMAAAGVFLGWQLVLVAACIGILIGGVYALYLLLVRKKGRKEHFAFGPALCAGIALSLFVGQPLIIWYLGFL